MRLLPNRVPPNKGVYVYTIRRRERYQRLSCGVWGRWKTVAYRRSEIAAREFLVTKCIQASNTEVAIFYRGKRLP